MTGACRTVKSGDVAQSLGAGKRWKTHAVGVPYLQEKEIEMPQERLPVRKIREVLRLKNEGFSNRAIARVCKISNSTVGEYLEKARQAGLSWPLPEGLSEETV